jgi:hypothetical protein
MNIIWPDQLHLIILSPRGKDNQVPRRILVANNLDKSSPHTHRIIFNVSNDIILPQNPSSSKTVSTLGGRRMSKGKVVTVRAIKAYREVEI